MIREFLTDTCALACLIAAFAAAAIWMEVLL